MGKLYKGPPVVDRLAGGESRWASEDLDRVLGEFSTGGRV